MPDAPSQAPLHETLLLAAPTPSARRPTQRWAYPVWGILLVSVFVLYHGAVLLVWNTPGKGLAKQFHSTFLKQVKGYEYFRGTRNTQGWSMFAPNPNRANTFMQAFAEDQDGQLWDFEQDIWEENRYPYIWYDRRGKVNRNLNGKKHYQRIYGAWICREWERTHGGESIKAVHFVRLVTKVPSAQDVIDNGGWDQWAVEPKRVPEETVTCKTVVHGTLPNELRERFGLELIDEDEELRQIPKRTWWDKQETERKKAERAAKREADRAGAHEQQWSVRRPSSGTVGAPDEPDEPAREEDSPDY